MTSANELLFFANVRHQAFGYWTENRDVWATNIEIESKMDANYVSYC